MDARANGLRVLQALAERNFSRKMSTAFVHWRRVVSLLVKRVEALKHVLGVVERANALRSEEEGMRLWKVLWRKGRRGEEKLRRAAARRIQAFFRMCKARQRCFEIKVLLHTRRVGCLRMLLLERLYKQKNILTQLKRNAAQRSISRTFRGYLNHKALLAERERELLERERMSLEEKLQRCIFRAIEAWRASNATRIQKCFLSCLRRRELETQIRSACEIQRWFRSILAVKKLRDAEHQAAVLLQRIARSHAARQQCKRLADELRILTASKRIQSMHRGYASRKRFVKRRREALRIQHWFRRFQAGQERQRIIRQRAHAARKIQSFIVEMHSRRAAGRVITRSVVIFLKRKRVLVRFTRIVIRILVRELLFAYFRGVRAIIIVQRRVRDRNARRDVAAETIQRFTRTLLKHLRREAAAGVIQRAFRRHSRERMLVRVKFRVRVRVCMIEMRAATTIQCAMRKFSAGRVRQRKKRQRDRVERMQRRLARRIVSTALTGWKMVREQSKFEALARTEEEKRSAVTIQRFVRGWQVRLTLFREAKGIADNAAFSNYLQWREAIDMKQEWELHVAEHQRQGSDINALKTSIRKDLKVVQAKEKVQAKAEINAWQKILIQEENPNHPGFEFYYYNPITGQTQASPPRGFIDRRRQEVETQGPPNPDELKWINLGWKRQFLSADSERPFIYRNNYTMQESTSRPRGYVEEQEKEQTEKDRTVCERCQEAPCSIICEVCSGTRICRRCFFETHRHPSLQGHNTRAVYPPWKPPEDDPDEVLSIDEEDFDPDMCARCQKRENEKCCDDCGESYCSSCFYKAHAHGRLTAHKSRKWVAPEWEEFFDDEDGEIFYFNQNTKERTTKKPMELIFGLERRRLLETAGLADQDRADEAELEFLEKEITSLETFKAQTLKQAREEVEEFKAYRRETATTTKLAKLIAPSLAPNESSRRISEVSSVETEGSRRAGTGLSSASYKKRQSQVKPVKREHASHRFAKARKQADADRTRARAAEQAYMTKLLNGTKTGP